jgi:hypothetical protein
VAPALAWGARLAPAPPRHILSLADLSCADVSRIVARSVALAGRRDYDKTLAGKAVGIYVRR